MSELPKYTSVAIAERDGLLTLSSIAELLRRKRQTVQAWSVRRRTSEFPMPKARLGGMGSRCYDLYSRKEVLDWYGSYVPATGGAPRGNRNWSSRHNLLTAARD